MSLILYVFKTSQEIVEEPKEKLYDLVGADLGAALKKKDKTSFQIASYIYLSFCTFLAYTPAAKPCNVKTNTKN